MSNDLVLENRIHHFINVLVEGVELESSLLCPLRTLTDEVFNVLLHKTMGACFGNLIRFLLVYVVVQLSVPVGNYATVRRLLTVVFQFDPNGSRGIVR